MNQENFSDDWHVVDLKKTSKSKISVKKKPKWLRLSCRWEKNLQN